MRRGLILVAVAALAAPSGAAARAEAAPSGLAAAHADAASSGLAEAYAGGSLVPTPTEERVRYQAALSGELARLLEKLDGVAEAQVILSDTGRDPLTVSLDPAAPVEAPRAAVVLRLLPGAAAPPVADVQKLVAAASPGISAESVTVALASTRPAPAPPALAHVGPFAVAASSRAGLVATFVVGLVAVSGLAVLVFVLAWKLAALRRRRGS